MKDNLRRCLFKAVLAARGNNWKLHRKNEWNYVFKRYDETYGRQTLNFYWNSKRNYRFTVQTTIDHPKKGRNQLNRKNLSIDQALPLFDNPRLHTGKGYR